MKGSYNIYNLMCFRLSHGRLGWRLEKFLSPFLRQGSEADVLDVHICRPSQFPENLTYDSSGVYKGIRWRLGFDRNSDGRVSAIYFYSMGFTSFLFLRFVIIPYLKHALIPLGGFYVLGSLFGVKKKVYFLFSGTVLPKI